MDQLCSIKLKRSIKFLKQVIFQVFRYHYYIKLFLQCMPECLVLNGVALSLAAKNGGSNKQVKLQKNHSK